jgi:hypothetical protein
MLTLILVAACEPHAPPDSATEAASTGENAALVESSQASAVHEFADLLEEQVTGPGRVELIRAVQLYADHPQVRAWVVSQYPTMSRLARERTMLVLSRTARDYALLEEMRPVVRACLDVRGCPAQSLAIDLASKLALPDLRPRLVAFIDIDPNGSVAAMFAALKAHVEQFGVDGIEPLVEEKFGEPWSPSNQVQTAMILAISAEGSWRQRGLDEINARFDGGFAEQWQRIAAGVFRSFVHMNRPGDARLYAHATHLAVGEFGVVTEAAREYLDRFPDPP